MVESLLARGYDEPFTLYGLLADSVETDAARSYVTFTINPAARFSDGKPVTPDDVIFSWQLLRDHGRPNYRIYYVKVRKAEAVGERSVRFDLAGADDRELPLILGLMPVLPKHAIDPDTFEETTFSRCSAAAPIPSARSKPGESVTFKRNPNYWGRDLPINRGLWNFDEIRFDYYRDGNTHFEAFKKGLYDVRAETDPGRWQTAYDFPALRDGRVVKESFPYGLPKGMHGLVFNTRRPIFADVRVREAILHLFDFEWINHNLFLRSVQPHRELFRRLRTVRPWPCRPMRASANCSRRFPARCAPTSWTAHGRRRRPTAPAATARACAARFALFAAAGYELKGTELVHAPAAGRFRFEILTTTRDRSGWRSPSSRNLKRAGIDAQVRRVDATQYERRRITFDFDMIEYRWEQSLSPGNEQSFYWGSAAADQEGTPQLHGRQVEGDRRHDRRDAQRHASATNSSPPPARSTGCCCRAFTWCRSIHLPRAMGGALDAESRIPSAPRCSAICRKPGGQETDRMIVGPRP